MGKTEKREKDRQDTERKRKRGSLKRWRQAQESTFMLPSMGHGEKRKREVRAYDVPSSQHPVFKAYSSRHALVKILNSFYDLVRNCYQCPRSPSTRTQRTNAGHTWK